MIVPPGDPLRAHPLRRALIWLAGCAAVLVLAGCIGVRREPPRPGRTTLDTPLVTLPAQNVGNFLLIEARWDRNGPYRFLIDTGSSVTLMSPTLVKRYPGSRAAGAPIRVRGAEGNITQLAPASLRRIELGGARFEEVPVLVYDPVALSAHLGVKIDGVLGFPLFREVLLTLDYPGSRVLLQPIKAAPAVPGAIIGFDDTRKTPLVPIQISDRTVVALIDSGSDAAFTLNPVGLDPGFEFGPRIGATIGTLAGDRTQEIGRLAESISIGGHVFERPIVELTDDLSTIGGGALKHFTVTFDQERNHVTFHRELREPIRAEGRRSAGMSFSKTPAYWRVVGIVPGSSAEAEGVQTGDLVTRINGEPVAKWDLPRYEQLVANGGDITFTLLLGNNETVKTVRVFDLVP